MNNDYSRKTFSPFSLYILHFYMLRDDSELRLAADPETWHRCTFRSMVVLWFKQSAIDHGNTRCT